MDFPSAFLPLLLCLLAPFQAPGDSFRKHYEAAEAYHRAGNLDAAEAEYAAILAEAYPAAGRVYAAQSNYPREVAAMEAAAARRPDSPEVLVGLAVAYFHAGQYRQAAAPLARVLARDPASAPARHMLGKTHFMTGEFERAAAELEAALKSAPKDYDAAYTLGLAYLKQRRLAEARQTYARLIEGLGDRPQLRILVGRAYRETGFLAEAVEEFKKAAALDPRFPRVHYHLGLTYLLKDGSSGLADAAKELQAELAAHPEEFLANYYLGVIHSTEGRWGAAAGLLEKAARLQPDNPDPYFLLGQAYQNLGRYEQAIEALRKSIALNPRLEHNDYQVTNAHYRLGQSLLKAGRTAEGERELQLASDLKSKAFKRDEAKLDAFLKPAGAGGQNKVSELVSPEGVVSGGSAPDAAAGEELRRAAEFYEKVIAAAHNNLGLLRAERQDFRGAAEQFASAARWNPRHEGLDYNLGLAYFKSESYKQAVAPLESELKARPSNLPAKQLLGLSYFMTEDYARAAALLAEVVAAKPDDAALYYPLALSLASAGKPAEAERVTRQMVAMGGNSPQVHILLGRAFYERNDAARALEELRAALALDPRVRLAHFYSGLIHLKSGRLE
ncbi:MAG TPA: tetratricopeptide repeat protein, partial [Pyrinomonadaceae bacterium]